MMRKGTHFINPPKSNHSQNGAVLVITVVVLLGLTVLGLASTKSNQMQSIMVRNNQFRLEAFNTSRSEIDAQVDLVNQRKLSDGIPAHILQLVNDRTARVYTSSEGGGSSNLPIVGSTAKDYVEQEVAERFQKECIILGQEVGAGKAGRKCYRFILESMTKLEGTDIESDQRQVFRYETPSAG